MARLHSPNKMVFVRRVAPLGKASVGWSFVPSDRLLPSSVLLYWAAVSAAFVAMILGSPLETSGVTLALCIAMLLFGLPHGTLDLALLGQARTALQNVGIVVLYLGLAAAMYAAWQIHSGLALLIFFGLSIAHFAEDWADDLPPIFAHGTAAALVLAPAILHRADLELLFEILVGAESAAVAINAVILLAPIVVAMASVSVLCLWFDGRWQLSVSSGLAIAAMLFLPPLVGFALFFCLMHSPTQFASGLASMGWQHDKRWIRVVIPMTAAALGLSAAIFVHGPVVSLQQTSVMTVFVTLSVLTLPHMIAPLLTEWLVTRYGQRSV